MACPKHTAATIAANAEAQKNARPWDVEDGMHYPELFVFPSFVVSSLIIECAVLGVIFEPHLCLNWYTLRA